MKIDQFISLAFFFLLIGGCASSHHIIGNFTNIYAGISGERFSFFNNPNKFKYVSSIEGATRMFSAGGWSQNENKLILDGFNEEPINRLFVKWTLTDYLEDNIHDKVEVKYNRESLDTFIKVNILINKNYVIPIQGDTVFLINIPVRSIQVKSFLTHEGLLLGTPPKIDTLYSKEYKMNNNKRHAISLSNFNLSINDFYRIKLTDTLIIKNDKVLLWGKKKFKKLPN